MKSQTDIIDVDQVCGILWICGCIWLLFTGNTGEKILAVLFFISLFLYTKHRESARRAEAARIRAARRALEKEAAAEAKRERERQKIAEKQQALHP